MSKRLLMLACSQRKHSTRVDLPALQRYNGPAYQVLHKYMREHPEAAQQIDVFILSAKFGLIRSDTPIPDYDQRMTQNRAEELRPQSLSTLKLIVVDGRYNELFFNMGKTYLDALAGYESLVPSNLKVTVAEGGIGHKSQALRNWLYQHTLTGGS